jgi:hypothetical protein
LTGRSQTCLFCDGLLGRELQLSKFSVNSLGPSIVDRAPDGKIPKFRTLGKYSKVKSDLHREHKGMAEG